MMAIASGKRLTMSLWLQLDSLSPAVAPYQNSKQRHCSLLRKLLTHFDVHRQLATGHPASNETSSSGQIAIGKKIRAIKPTNNEANMDSVERTHNNGFGNRLADVRTIGCKSLSAIVPS
jgi:hypothetical protein